MRSSRSRSTARAPWWASAVVLLVGIGCAGPQDDDGTLLPSVDTVDFSEVIPTVVTVSWDEGAGEPSETYLEYGLQDTFDEVVYSANDNAGEHTVLLLGLKAGETYHLRAVSIVDGTRHVSEQTSVTAGDLPTGFPRITLDTELFDNERAAGGYFLTSWMPGCAVILDGDGDPVWWYSSEQELAVQDDTGFGLTTSHLALAADGEYMVYMAWETLEVTCGPSDDRFVVRVAPDGSSQEIIPSPLAHHDFLELPDGTITRIEYDFRNVTDRIYIGDKLVERSPDGEETTVWSIWDSIPYQEEYDNDPDNRWGHCNAVDYDANDDTYYISSRDFNTIFKVDRSTGQEQWKLGGIFSDFTLTTGDEDDWFENEHQFQFVDDKFLVFDNGPDGQSSTRVMEYRLDYANWTIEPTREILPPTPLGIFAMGDATYMESGNIVVTWSGAGMMEEIAPNDDVVWRVNLDLGTGFGYTTWMPSLM